MSIPRKGVLATAGLVVVLVGGGVIALASHGRRQTAATGSAASVSGMASPSASAAGTATPSATPTGQASPSPHPSPTLPPSSPKLVPAPNVSPRPTPTPSPSPSPSPSGLLPGEQLWGPNKASSYIFGTNDSVNYGSPNVENAASVQSYVKQGRLTLLRELFQSNMTDADIQARLNTVAATGMHCLALLDAIDNLTFMRHVVQLTAATCPMYEFGNEPDGNGVSVSTYLSDWNTDIPQLRALAPGAKFGGPASLGADGFLQSFIQGSASSGVTPDFISFHEYPCFGATSQTDCLTNRTSGALDYDQSTVVGWEQQYLGHRVPTGITEYNFDPGGANLGAWAGDASFMFKWTELAIQRFIADGYDFATQYTSLNYSGYGALDMFNDSAPYSPKAQFWGLVDEGQKNGSGSTLVLPNPCC